MKSVINKEKKKKKQVQKNKTQTVVVFSCHLGDVDDFARVVTAPS